MNVFARNAWRKPIPAPVCAGMLFAGFMGMCVSLGGGLAAAAVAPVTGIALMCLTLRLSSPPPIRWRRCFGLRNFRKADLALLGWSVPLLLTGNGLLLFVSRSAIEYFELPFATEQSVAVWMRAVAGRPLAAAALTVTVTVLIPPFEELFFRRVLFGWFRSMAGGGTAALAASAVFAAAHFFPAGMPTLFWMGLVLQYLYGRSRNLWVPTAAHAVVNLTAAIALLAEA